MKFEIKNRWTGAVMFECELSAEIAGKAYALQLGFAVRSARASGADLSDANLLGAELRCANLRGAELRGANLRDANLRGANLSDANLRDANLRGANLSGADLSDANLLGAELRGADLRGAELRCANLRDADLRGAELRGANLRDANLRGADLSDANLRGADLRGADLRDCPVKIKGIHQAVYAAASKPDALNMSNWHTCDTTHCRAGWVVALAGDGGRALEYLLGTSAAASIIYMASDPGLEKIPDFYCGNQDAMDDMKRLSDAESAA